MNGQFDPYYTWLGIPPAEQPPHHYRLLGIQRFEANAEVIDHAADRLMMHLRSFQNGPNSAESQQLLNEVSAARSCLQDAAKKAAYDTNLRRLNSPPLPPVSIPSYSPVPPAAPPIFGGRPARPKTPRAGYTPFDIAKIALGSIAVVAVTVMALQYATGIDLVGWGAQGKKEKGVKGISPLPPQKPAATMSSSKTPSQPTHPSTLPPAPKLPTAQPKAPPIAANGTQPREVYDLRGPTLPKNVSIKIVNNNVHPDGLVTLEEEPLPAEGAWVFENQELLLTSIERLRNTAVQITSSAGNIREFRVRARTTIQAPASVRFSCGNVYVILNWEVEDQNHILIDGRRAEVTSPHCLAAGKLHEIVLQQSAGVVHVLVDEKEVISAKGAKFANTAQIGTSHLGTIGVRSVEIVPDSRVAAAGGLQGRFDIRYSNETRRDYLFDKGGEVTCLGGIYKSEVKPIPPLPIPMKGRVFWHEEDGHAVGWIPWPDTKVERVVVDHEVARFILFPSDGSVTGEARATAGSAPADMSNAAIVGRLEILYSSAARRDYLFEKGGAVTFLGEANPGQSGAIPPLPKPVKSTVSWHQEDGHLAGFIFWSSGPRVERVIVNDDGRMKFTLFSDVGSVTGETPKSAPKE